MKVRIGNDIRINLTIKGPKEYTYTNVKQIKCLIINECLGDCGCDCECGRCPIERRFPMEPFPLYYTPTPWTLNACGKARYHTDPWNCKADYCVFAPHFHDYHWWPGYRGFGECPKKFIGDCCRFHMNHAMDIFYCNGEPHCHHGHCKPCPPCPCPCGDKDFVYCAKVEFLEEPNRVSCIFPAYDQIMLGSYKVVLIVTTYEQGWGCRNLHTETIDYGTAFELVDTEEGQLGYIVIDLDQPEPEPEPTTKPKMYFPDDVEDGLPQFILNSNSWFDYTDDDPYLSNTYLILVNKDGNSISPNTQLWTEAGYGNLIYTATDSNLIVFDRDNNVCAMDIGTANQDTTVTITVVEENNKLLPLVFTVLVKAATQPTPPEPTTVSSINIVNVDGVSMISAGLTVTFRYEISGQYLSNSAIIVCNGRTINPQVTYITNTRTSKIATFVVTELDYRDDTEFSITVMAQDDMTKTATSETVDVILLPLILKAYYGFNGFGGSSDHTMHTLRQTANANVEDTIGIFVRPNEHYDVSLALGNLELRNYDTRLYNVFALVTKQALGTTLPPYQTTIPINEDTIDFDSNVLGTVDAGYAPSSPTPGGGGYPLKIVVDIVCSNLLTLESIILLKYTLNIYNTYINNYVWKLFATSDYGHGEDLVIDHTNDDPDNDAITVFMKNYDVGGLHTTDGTLPVLLNVLIAGMLDNELCIHVGDLTDTLERGGDFIEQGYATPQLTYRFIDNGYTIYKGVRLYPVFMLHGAPDDGASTITGVGLQVANWEDRTEDWSTWADFVDEIAHEHYDCTVNALVLLE